MRFPPTAEQRAIVELQEGCHLVVAPPGSGKTSILTWRALHLLRGDPEATWRILALTFTTKAAQELRDRIEQELRASDPSLLQRLSASTLHAFCLDVLQHYGDLVGFPSPVTVYDDADRADALAMAIADEGRPPVDEAEIRRVLFDISKAKRDLSAPQDEDLGVDGRLFAAYDRALARQGACDYDDLLRFTWRLFSEQPKVARHYRRIYRHVLVDEAQDTSAAQYMVLRALCEGTLRDVMFVADARQAIYGWNGASSEYLSRFERDFAATRHRLVGNFRSARQIVEFANRLAQSMPGGDIAPMVAAGTAEGRVRIFGSRDEDEEATKVADWIAELLRDGLPSEVLESSEGAELQPEDIAVLGRTRRSIQAVRHVLEDRGLPVLYSEGGRSPFEHPLAALVVQGLRFLQNPKDEVLRGRIAREWKVDGDPLAALSSTEGATGHVAGLLLDLDREEDPAPTLDLVMETLREATCDLEESEGEALLDQVEALVELVDRWKGETAGHPRTLGSFLAHLAMAGRPGTSGPGVRVLTIHAAKGLEFRAVAVMGWDEGSIPDFRARTQDQLLEERRSAYVAVTRASRDLLLTWPQSRRTRYGSRAQARSRFLDELLGVGGEAPF